MVFTDCDMESKMMVMIITVMYVYYALMYVCPQGIWPPGKP